MTETAETTQEPGIPHRPSYGFAKRHGVLLTEVGADAAVVLVRPDARPSAVAELRRLVRRPLRLEAVDNHRFDQLLAAQYDRSGEGTESMIADMEDELDLSRIADSLPEPEDLLESEDDAPIIRLINAILSQAVKENASDVHVEPFEDRVTVRLRVDGAMREILEPPRSLAGLIVSRIKVMARLDIAEKRLPQDGRISLRVGGRPVDVRVSTLPSGHGERVVLRLLDKQAGRLDLGHLGMDPETHARIKGLINRPHGIILVTGPTGSGKTTTLYAVLGEINDRSRNILTVEDPVEYFIDGIGQTQVNTKVDMSFARGLRAILRQDPDVVMVGEIRDLETAEIAVQAGLTGHLVFSTLHTNTAVGAVTRLRDMGVEPFLLSSTLLAVLAQRLVRLLCQHCKEPYELTAYDRQLLGIGDAEAGTVFRPVGCPACRGTGYQGRSGIYELLVVDAAMRQQIHDGASEAGIEEHARRATPSIRDDGLRRILAGHTSIEEVLRVTRTA
ncbi:MAG: type II secretion system ATPase GspE [Chromatiales bacterium]|jgi:general secretion pathway protein E